MIDRPVRCASCLLLLVLAAGAPPPGFSMGVVDLGDRPQRLAAGDLDGDGDVDLAVLGVGTGDLPLTVLLQEAGGAFAPGWSASLGALPWKGGDLDLLDVDLDGDLDALACVAGATSQSRLNAGDATFDSFVPHAAAGVRVQNAPGLLDGDALPDNAAWGIRDGGLASGERGLGDGSFAPASSAPAGGSDPAARCGLADLDADGLADLVRADVDGVHFTRGLPGAFPGWGADVLLWFDAAADLELGDLDGDGLDDALASIPAAGAIEVFRGQPGGPVGVAPFPAGPTPGAIALADLDGDGDLDVAIVNQVGGTLSVNANDGNAVFLDLQSYRGGRSLTDLVSADLDGDGDADLAATSSAGRVGLFFNQALP